VIQETALAVVDHGRLVCHEGGARPDRPWWSFGKTVVAVAALRLVQEGALALDTPLSGRPYTLRQLLQHRSGLGDYGSLAAYHDAVAADEEPWPEQELLDRVEADRLRYPSGRGWDYSNLGYYFIRRLIERTTGVPLAEALGRLVFQPLGISRTRLASKRPDLTGVYRSTDVPYHPNWVYPGLLVGPLDEAALLLDKLLSGDCLTPDLLREMGNAYPLGGPIEGRPWLSAGYGLGLMIGRTTSGLNVLGHTGGGPVSVCAIYHCPESARTVAAAASGEDPNVVESAVFAHLATAG